jgi:hypothetical protein
MIDVSKIIEEYCQLSLKESDIEVHPSHVVWYSWPESFGSTAGPHGGAGGQTVTSFQVFGLMNHVNDFALLFCGGKWRRWRKRDCMSWHGQY